MDTQEKDITDGHADARYNIKTILFQGRHCVLIHDLEAEGEPDMKIILHPEHGKCVIYKEQFLATDGVTGKLYIYDDKLYSFDADSFIKERNCFFVVESLGDDWEDYIYNVTDQAVDKIKSEISNIDDRRKLV